jgi:FMN-dependent NADH-azoreductase
MLLSALRAFLCSVPYPLKHYIDIVVQPGLTFRETDKGAKALEGRDGRQLILVTSTGGDYSAGSVMASKDFLTP